MKTDSYTVTLDDDPIVSAIVERFVGLPTLAFSSGQALLKRAPSLAHPFGIFVDIHLGISESGLDLVPALRELWPQSPVIVVTASRVEETIAKALAAGAHDFVRKPLSRAEVNARLRVRRAELLARAARDELIVGDLRFDRVKRQIERVGQQCGVVRYLSTTAASLLLCLASAPGSVVSKDELRAKIWGRISVSENAVRKKIFEVRVALRDVSEAVAIETVYGGGVRLTILNEPKEEE